MGEGVWVDVEATRLLDDAHRGLDERQGPQPEEVHLHEPELLDRAHVVLRDGRTVSRAEDGGQVGDGVAGDHDAGRVHGGVARQAFERLGDVDVAAGALVVELAQLGDVAQGVVDPHAPAHDHRDELADLVGLRERDVEDARRVLDGSSGGHRPERGDVRHALLAVLLPHVVDDLAAPHVGEVDVEVGHRDTLGVEEALEEQAEAQRVDVDDAHAVSDDGPRPGAAPGPDADALGLRPVDEVGDDQVVVGEPHRDDHGELVLAPRQHRVGVGLLGRPGAGVGQLLLQTVEVGVDVAPSAAQRGPVIALELLGAQAALLTRARQGQQDVVERRRGGGGTRRQRDERFPSTLLGGSLLEVGAHHVLGERPVALHRAAVGLDPELVCERQPGRQLDLRHLVDALRADRQLQRDHVSDRVGVADGTGVLALRDRRGHLRRALDVELVAREPHPVLVRDHLLRLDREEHVVRVRVLTPDVVAVVRGDHADPVPVGELAQHRVQPPLLLEPVVLDLHPEVGAEDVEMLLEEPLALLGTEVEDRPRHLRSETAGESDHALGMLAQELHVYARLHVEALEVGAAREPAQVLVALEVLGEQGQVVVTAVELGGAAPLLEAGAGSDVRLEADDRLDPFGDARLVELDRPVHVAVVRHRDGRVVGGDLLDPANELGDAGGPVQEAVSGVLVEVGEALDLAGHAASLSRLRAPA